jgi:hypothetical protein
MRCLLCQLLKWLCNSKSVQYQVPDVLTLTAQTEDNPLDWYTVPPP